jgi:hypothetical protein
MMVRVIVVRPPSDTIALQDIAYPLTKGHQYGLSIQIEPAKSGNIAMGAGSYRKFPLRGSMAAGTDSLWLYYINGVPCKGCVY